LVSGSPIATLARWSGAANVSVRLPPRATALNFSRRLELMTEIPLASALRVLEKPMPDGSETTTEASAGEKAPAVTVNDTLALRPATPDRDTATRWAQSA
jgi:hypothetical protein